MPVHFRFSRLESSVRLLGRPTEPNRSMTSLGPCFRFQACRDGDCGAKDYAYPFPALLALISIAAARGESSVSVGIL
jgi:hypothetical protein